eukprot:GDKI01020379.1.p1 GENE.GDKI01020379.1~~GDKI01020379.1.p1  ORF type:complete len:165 (+),score=56.22 GDKI01020379.1:74-496(+)
MPSYGSHEVEVHGTDDDFWKDGKESDGGVSLPEGTSCLEEMDGGQEAEEYEPTQFDSQLPNYIIDATVVLEDGTEVSLQVPGDMTNDEAAAEFAKTHNLPKSVESALFAWLNAEESQTEHLPVVCRGVLGGIVEEYGNKH